MVIVPTKYWHKLDDSRVQCDVCPRECKMREGQRGLCSVRGVVNDELVLLSYGEASGFCIDPIEKKPLNHFLPGTPVLSLGQVGCNLTCRFCQNHSISKAKSNMLEYRMSEAQNELKVFHKTYTLKNEDETANENNVLSTSQLCQNRYISKSRKSDRFMHTAMPEMIAGAAKQSGCRSVAYTYNDPVIFLEYAVDVSQACHEQGIKNVAVTAGYIEGKAREEFFTHMDAANVDLKCFTEEFYHQFCSAKLTPVLDTLKYLKHETNVWFEITNLLIPGENDSEVEIEKMTQWIIENLGSDVPIHFTAFHPDWKMQDKPRTPPETLFKAYNIARKNGIQYVYTGNIHDERTGSTYCNKCSGKLIGRDWYELTTWNISIEENYRGNCATCGEAVAGIFENTPGTWGRKRQSVRIS
jgi:pyruvate formate lyase activating enzyme